MLCVTGGETSSGALAARLGAHQQHALQEVRLDLLLDLDDSVFSLLRGPRIVATCRSVAEGGGFRGSEAERLAVLRRALRERPGYLDVELSVAGSIWDELAGTRGTTELVCSHHVHDPRRPLDVPALGRALTAVPAQILKLAVMIEDAADLLPLLELRLDRPLLRLGMGPAGLISRALYRRFGSPWTYVHADTAPATAQGQLSVGQAVDWRLDSRAHEALVLVGGEQVMSSPGPLVYNRLFTRRGLPYLYLPVISRRPGPLLELLERLGVVGASVTMPLKESLLAYVDELRPPADRIGAVNTVRPGPGPRLGWNTDAPAVAALAGPGAGRRALVLGAGGAARAAALGLLEEGWSVRICGRSAERTLCVARSLGVTAVAWTERGDGRETLLCNATPCGSDRQTDPIPARSDWRDAVVLDLVLSLGAPTPLLRRAAAGGARTISGVELWLEQGARQMSWLLGTAVSPDELRSCLS